MMRSRRIQLSVAVALAASLCIPATAVLADDFAAGSLIIPMDTDYQDMGMFKAFGLVYSLLSEGVPVQWTIREDKDFGEADFTASATDYDSGEVVTDHGYRAGPFVIDVADVAAAEPIIDAWLTDNETAVHEATTAFAVDVAQYLVAAPTIAMFADGNEDIARGYVLAAGIPDSTGDLDWPDDSPDMLDIDEVSGLSETNHSDGALFDDEGNPVYCQLMSMHWKIDDAEDNPEVVAEVRQFLRFPTHFFAECQAVNAFENNVNGHFLTEHGFMIDNLREGDPVDFYNPASPFGQMDGTYELVGGSERSYTPCGDANCDTPGAYLAGGVVMITGEGTPEAVQDVWMTGFLDGGCPPEEKFCEIDGEFLGKVSYLGGHEYSTDLPISENPRSVGTRLFLQSLFEAPCATREGQPEITLDKIGASAAIDGEVTYELRFENTGAGFASSATIVDPIPAGAAFVSATDDGMLVDGAVTWMLGTVAPGASGSVFVTLSIDELGVSIENTATLDYLVGVSDGSVTSNTVTTLSDTDSDGDGIGDSVDACPDHVNLTESLDDDPNNCGECGNACASETCAGGVCADVGGDVDTDVDIDAGDAGMSDTGDSDAGTDAAADSGDDVEPDTEVDGGAEDAEADSDNDGATNDDTANADITTDGELTDAGEDASNGGGVTDEGCGCSQTEPSGAPLALSAMALGAILVRRRRR